MVTTFYPPYCESGDGEDVRRLARALVARGHLVDVIHDTDAYRLLTGQVPEPVDDEAGIRVHRLRSPTKFISSLGVQQLGRPTTHRERLEELLTGRYDVIHYHNVSLIGGPGVWSIGTGVKLHSIHDFWLACPSHTLWRDNKERCDKKRCIRCVLRQGRPPQFWRTTRAISRNARHIDAFLAPSRSAEAIHKRFGFDHPMETGPVFADGGAPRLRVTARDAAPKRPYFFFSGPLVDMQGLADVIPQFDADLGADLVIAGIGTNEAELRRLALNRSGVSFLGRQPEAELTRLRRNAVAVIAPFRGHEIFPFALLDAYRNGVPALARDIEANREVIDATGGGRLFSTGVELRGLLYMLANDPAYAAELGRQAFSGFARLWREDIAIERYFGTIKAAALRRGMTDLVSKLDDPYVQSAT